MADRAKLDMARALIAGGRSQRSVALELGLPPTTLHRWLRHAPRTGWHRCWLCLGRPPRAEQEAPYLYLLGQYLGDGHLVTTARVPVLRIYACTDYPDIAEEVARAIRQVRGTLPGFVHPAKSDRVVTVQSYWRHWPCLFPQHGPGRKHERRIVLADWQQALVDAHPWPLIKGLIDSDGCRAINRVTVRGRQYEYPRYFFSNMSPDILAIMGRTLDGVGVAWRFNRYNSISIARRDAVALLEEHVGPKR